MRSDGKAEADRSAEVTTSAGWRVQSVRALPGFRIFVRFNDGTEGEVDLGKLLESPRAGVFAALRDERRFREVRVQLGAVTWPGDLDLAPDAMYRAIRENGTWIVQ